MKQNKQRKPVIFIFGKITLSQWAGKYNKETKLRPRVRPILKHRLEAKSY